MSSSISVTKYGQMHVRKNPLQERLDIKLQSADGILELVLLQDLGVQSTKAANNLVLAANAEVDRGGVAGEVGGVYEKYG